MVPGPVSLNMPIDILEALLVHINLAWSLAETSVTTLVHGVTVSLAILDLVELRSWRLVRVVVW